MNTTKLIFPNQTSLQEGLVKQLPSTELDQVTLNQISDRLANAFKERVFSHESTHQNFRAALREFPLPEELSTKVFRVLLNQLNECSQRVEDPPGCSLLLGPLPPRRR